MRELEISVDNALHTIESSIRFNGTVSDQLIVVIEAIARQQIALSTMLDLFYINRMRLAKEGSLAQLLELLKEATQTHDQIQDAALEIGRALRRALEDVVDGTTH